MKTQLFTSHNSILRSEFHSQHRHPSYFRSIGQRKHKTKFSPTSFSKFLFSINRSSFFSKRKKKKKREIPIIPILLKCMFLSSIQTTKKKKKETIPSTRLFRQFINSPSIRSNPKPIDQTPATAETTVLTRRQHP